MEHFLRNLLHVLVKRTYIRNLYRKYKYYTFYKSFLRNNDNLARIKGKKKYKVAFFVIHASVWKCEYVYRIMEKNPLFEPIIVVCPAVNFGRENMIEVMEECYERFKNGYNCIKTYDQEKDTFLDIRESISPDIIFYTNPYRGLIHENYFIDKFPDILTCYVPYYWSESAEYGFCHNQELHNLVWKIFSETETHKKFAQKYAYNKGINVEVTGYPGIDRLIDEKYSYKDVWKIKNRNIKRIIWAPHHTFADDEVIKYSCFLYIYDCMMSLAEKYKNKVQFAFKPHPLLKVKLYKYWGKEKTDRYYKYWEESENTMFCNRDYTDLFLSSDAIIHDCGSFIAEYLYTGKPGLYTLKNEDTLLQFNDLGKECLDVYYIANDKEDIEKFIINIIEGNDELKDKRNTFIETKLLPENKKLASDNIVNIITNSLSN